MNEPFLIFQSFNDAGLAQDIAGKLAEHNISFQIEDTSSPIDPVIIGSALTADIRIKLKQQDFAKANAVLESYYESLLDSVDKDYYLFGFTDEELKEIIEKPDEWGQFDYKLAQKILKDKGKEIEEEELELIKSGRLKEISKPEEVGKSWIFLGYFLAVLFGPLGIFFGSTVATLKKTLPNGEKVYSYSENSRRHGKNILIISSILTALLILWKIFSSRQD